MTKWLLTALTFFLFLPSWAQKDQSGHIGEIYNQIEKIRTLGSVLYVAAHPDDENTRFIAWCANEKNVETAYISLTRGDGGQNLIGTEKGKLLGVIRTHELLAARDIDRGEQFFSRANDFGYSKTAEETFNIWDRDKVLADLVWVIRKFRPDVIVTRFPPPQYGYQTHGHHQASAILANEAFDLAGNPNAYPGQLEYVETWQPKRLYWNTSTWFYRRTEEEFDPAGKVMIDVGTYSPMLGKSMGEIAGLSRSQHKSQGFGAEETMGSIEEWFVYVKGDSITSPDEDPKTGILQKDLFDGIDLTWYRSDDGAEIQRRLDEIYENFDPKEPAAILPEVMNLYKLMKYSTESEWAKRKLPELEKLILMLGGVFAEVNAEESSTNPGSKVSLTARVIARNGFKVKVNRITLPDGQTAEPDTTLAVNNFYENEMTLTIPEDQPFTHPYWLRQPMDGIGMYQVEDQQMIGLPDNPPALPVEFTLEVAGEEINITRDIYYNYVDRVEGELKEQLVVAPPVTANLSSNQVLFSEAGMSKEISVTLKAWKDSVTVKLIPEVSNNWKVTRQEKEIFLEKMGDQEQVELTIQPPMSNATGNLTLRLEVNGNTYNRSHTEIDYDHIPKQTLFPETEAKLVKLDFKKQNENIGYIMGAGDEVATYLEQVGYNVTMINESNFNETDWSQFDAVMVGIRTFNTEEWLFPKWDRVLQFAKDGGTLIVQYQTTWGLKMEDFGPYDLKIGRDRVTVEQAEMRPIDKDHPVLNTPNKLTGADFENWVQERGLYFAESWGKEYQPIFSANDPGEDPHKGALVVADYGKGKFVYTGISVFRHLPAGVPGSYRLLANIIALGN